MGHFDAIIIPGGGLTETNTLPPHVLARFERAISQYTREYMIPLSAGTVHKPLPRDTQGLTVFEAVVGATYLIENGIPKEKILPETSSYDTIGNAFFSRILHTDIRNFKKLLIITSDFHLERTKLIFEWVYSLAPKHNYQLEFIGTSDEAVDAVVLEARKKKEAQRMLELAITKEKITTLSELHAWIYTQHEAYAPGLTPKKETGILLQNY